MNFGAYAELTADFPDDGVEGDGGFVIFPGRTAAEAIASALRDKGYEVGPAEHMEEHGWDLNVRVEEKRIWLEIQDLGDEYVLQIEAMVGFFQRLRGVDLGYFADFLTKLNEGLRNDARFRSVKWYPLKNNRPSGEPSDDPLAVMKGRG